MRRPSSQSGLALPASAFGGVSPKRRGRDGGSERRYASRVEGFTLVELLLVVIIIGILAALVIPKFAGRSEEARIAAAKADIGTLSSSLEMYEGDTGAYPAGDEGLQVLIQAPAGLKEPEKWKGPYLRQKDVPLDPWGSPYKYTYPGAGGPKTFDLRSAGPDKQDGTEDDISN